MKKNENINDPFSILNISSLATPEMIKKTFRSLIYSYHPDTAKNFFETEEVSRIITAYKQALEIASKNRDELYSNFETMFYGNFSFPFIKPDTPGKMVDHFNILLSSLESILYVSEKLSFFKQYIEILLLELSTLAESSFKQFLISLFSGFKFLITSRIEARALRDNQGEYTVDPVRSFCIDYFKKIFSGKDYLRIRNIIFSQKDSITGNIARSLYRDLAPVYKREIFSLLMIIVLFSEEEFFEMWFDSLPD